MRQILARMCLLAVLLPLSGCGAEADAPQKEVTDAEKQKKAEESRAAMEKGMQRAEQEKGAPPVH